MYSLLSPKTHGLILTGTVVQYAIYSTQVFQYIQPISKTSLVFSVINLVTNPLAESSLIPEMLQAAMSNWGSERKAAIVSTQILI